MSFSTFNLETGDPFEEQELEEAREEVLDYLDSLGPHPSLAHYVLDEDYTTPGASRENLEENIDSVSGVDIYTTLGLMHRRGDIYPVGEEGNKYAITFPSERIPKPDRDDGIEIVRFSFG